MKKLALLAALLALIPFARADIITPLDRYTLPFIPVIILLETIILWLFIRKDNFSFWRALFACTAANLVTSFIGLFFPVFGETGRGSGLMFSTAGIWVWVLVALVLSWLIEFVIWLPFYKKYENKLKLFAFSFVANLASYILVLWLMLNKGLF